MSSSTFLSRFRPPLRNLIPISHAFSRPFSARRGAPAEPPEPGGRHPKLFVVQPRLRPDDLLQAKLSEALNLANSLEEQRDGRHEGDLQDKKLPPFSVVQNPLARSGGHADTYFGLGTVENIKCQINAMDSKEQSDAIFVNAVLSGVQQRNLERAWGKPVLDRIGLIIEIFNAHAQTKEAKLQSELAALMYKRTRLVRVRGPDGRLSFGTSGEAEVVSAKGKGSGGRGFLSGAGESEIQLQRQRIQERRDRLLHEIEEVRRTRALQRYARKRRGGTEGQGPATVAVVGYTNAGKSTLVSALSHNDLYKDDRLFATVDPRLRSVILPSGRKVLLSDTVGFISDLPVQLIEAFHATLEEVVDADLLVHVIDSCAKNVEEQRSAVLDVLNQIGVSEEKIRNMIEVWNKIDLLSSEPEDVLNVEDNFDVCSDEEGCSADQNEISSVRSLDETIYECSESKGESDKLLTEGENLEDGNGVCSESKDESDQLLTEGEYLEDGNANSQLNKVDDAFTHILFSGMMPKESHAVEHQGVTAYREDGSEVSSQDSQESLQKYADIDDFCSRSSFEWSAGTTNPDIQLHGGSGIGESAICRHKHARVETSAITRVGLKELLYVIDEKLRAQELPHHRVDYFGRKWRPSYSVDEGSTINQ